MPADPDYCGFNDARNFTQALKRWEGLTPTEYRNQAVAQ
jgi:AraC-like DNA-binding protein